MSDALLVVPPLLKSMSQPLLGPAMLAGAGRAAGHRVAVLDLNQRFVERERPWLWWPWASPIVGDHDRSQRTLDAVQRSYWRIAAAHLPPVERAALSEDPARVLAYGHHVIETAARRLAASRWGWWMSRALPSMAPDVLGISVLFSGQVLFGLALSLIARQRWPEVRILWGGPHVTMLEHEIAADPRYGWVVDGFVFGYAERTWVEVLDAVAAGRPLPPEVVVAGCGRTVRARENTSVVPVFDEPDRYGRGRITLPIQASRGCAYGKCRYCTYPVVEGKFRKTRAEALEPVVAQAEALGACLAFKDSLIPVPLLRAIGDLIDGRVAWSACTKLHRGLDGELLALLARQGCRTLEVGLETLTESGQLIIDKKQSPDLLHAFLDGAEDHGIAVVINYMTGLPGVAPEDEAWGLDTLRRALRDRPSLFAKIEHNTLQLERRAPLLSDPRIVVHELWPWASVTAWSFQPEQLLSERTAV